MNKEEIEALAKSIEENKDRKKVGIPEGLLQAIKEAAEEEGFTLTKGPRSELVIYLRYLLLARPTGAARVKAIRAFRTGTIPK